MKKKCSCNNDEKCNNEKKKKGIFAFFAMIWESMVKTGGCCGAGGSCGPTSDKNKNGKREGKK